MTNAHKIKLLQRVLDQSEEITVRDSSDPKFKTWKNTVERTLIRVFGLESPELEQFQRLRFFYRALIMTLGTNYSREHRECFDRDFEILTSSLKSYIEELQQEVEEDTQTESDVRTVGKVSNSIQKVFISHSSKDVHFVEEVIDILEVIGLDSDKIFCSSFAGYDIQLGENFLETIREELNSESLVLFVLTKHFYESPTCLCEMGATWVQTREHIPILIPPFDYPNIQGVIPMTQGFKLNDPLKLNLFRERIESIFGATGLKQTVWERRRDRIIDRINAKITTQTE